VAVGFLLAAPTINPIVIWSTWVAFRDRPEMVLWRVLLTLVIATLVGAIFSTQKDLKPILHPNLARGLMVRGTGDRDDDSRPALLRSGTYLIGQGQSVALDNPAVMTTEVALLSGKAPRNTRFVQFLDNIIRELRELGGVLVLGSAIVAIIQVAVPREAIVNLGQGTIVPILTMMLLALVVSICSTVDAFFALSFASTFTSSALLAFLVFGPTIDLKSIGLMLSVFQPRAVFYLFALTAQLTFLFALALHIYVL
jgi:hypothetical protein